MNHVAFGRDKNQIAIVGKVSAFPWIDANSQERWTSDQLSYSVDLAIIYGLHSMCPVVPDVQYLNTNLEIVS